MTWKYSPPPNWSEVFTKIPELEAPGYQEAKQAIFEKRNANEADKIRQQMQEINKEKVSAKNRNRSQAKRSRSAKGN
jgi:hypothetical protein